MNTEPILERLRAVIARTGVKSPQLASATVDTPIDSLGIDSLALLDLLYEVQQEFGIEIDPESLAGARTVGDLIARLPRS